MNRIWISILVTLAGVFLFASMGSTTALPPAYAPMQAAYHYGDADGDTAITVSDMNVVLNYVNAQPYTFYTLQPDNPDADWNTCDVDSDQALTVSDKNILLNYINAQPVTIPDKPWVIERCNSGSCATLSGVDLRDTYNTVGVFFPFNVNLSSVSGASGRPGISVIANIIGGTTTGSMSGRECDVLDQSIPDQPALPGAQCALAVSITDWITDTTLGLTESGTYGLQVKGNAPGILYIDLSIQDSGLNVPAISVAIPVTFSYPVIPTLAGSYDTPDLATDVYVSGNYAYVSDASSGLQIINVSNPALPTFAGSYNTKGFAWSVYVSGNYAYVVDDWNGLQIIDVSNPALPTLAGSYDTPGYAYSVYVSGDYAFVADADYGLQIINISNPALPTLVGSYDTPGIAFEVYVSGNYAYVADETYGLQIINISNPALPTLVGSYDTLGYAYGVYVSGNYAFVADADYGLQIINISNPALPTLVGSYNTPGWAYEVYVSGNNAYVADWEGLQIINVSNPALPTFAGSYDTPGWAHGVYGNGNYAFVADWAYGLQIIQVLYP